LVQSARAAGGKRPDGRDPRILASQGGDQALLSRMRFKMGFREAIDWLPGYRRPLPNEDETALGALCGLFSLRAAAPVRAQPKQPVFETPLLSISRSHGCH